MYDKSQIENKIFNQLIIFSTIIIYLNSRIDANLFKIIFILIFCCILLANIKTKLKINKNIIFFFFYIFFNIIIHHDSFIANFFTLSYFLIIFISYYYYSKSTNLVVIINTYINFCILISLLGLTQEFLFLINNDYLFYLSKNKNPDFLHVGINILRVASLLDEPSKLGLFLLPSILLGYGRFFLKIKQIKISFLSFLIILSSFILTFSAHAFLSMIISVILIVYFEKNIKGKTKFIVFVIFAAIAPFIFTFDVVSEKLINAGIFTGKLNLNGSTLGTSSFFYVGFKCILKIIKDFNFFGVGMMNYHYFSDIEWQKINMERYDDGSNIGYARIIVEFGILGICLLIFFFYINFAKPTKTELNKDEIFLFFINKVCFLFIFVDLFRMGFYINPPIIFFSSLFIVSKQKLYYSLKNN